MNFDLTPDLKLLNDSVNKLLEQYRGPLPVGHAAFVLDGSAIADDIARNGYLEVVKEYGAEHGVLAGLLVIESACRRAWKSPPRRCWRPCAVWPTCRARSPSARPPRGPAPSRRWKAHRSAS